MLMDPNPAIAARAIFPQSCRIHPTFLSKRTYQKVTAHRGTGPICQIKGGEMVFSTQ